MDPEKLNKIAGSACRLDGGVDVRNRRYLFKTFPSVFVGSEMVDWIMQDQHCARPAALAVGNQLHKAGFFVHCVDSKKPFLDGFYFYNFTSKAIPSTEARPKETIERETIKSLREVLVMMFEPGTGIDVKDRRYRLKTYKNCFVASEAIDWMMKQPNLPIRSREEANKLASKLVDNGYIEHVVEPQPFKDSYLFFRFTTFAVQLVRDGEDEADAKLQIDEEISVSNFDILAVLGEGGYGKVMQVRKKDTGKVYAMKAIEKSKISSQKSLEHIITEQKVLQNDHPFLLHLHFSFQTPTKLFLVTDYIGGGDLFFHLAKRKAGFHPKVAKFLIAELILALEHLHHCGVIYRDLKLENVLLDEHGHICLADFGLSKVLDDSSRTQTFCGSQGYLAPEILKGEKYTYQVDWFSLGVMLYELISGNNPFLGQNFQETCRNLLKKQVYYPADVFSKSSIALITALLQRDPEARIKTAAELKRHPYFKSIDWSKLSVKKVKPPFKIGVASETDLSNFDQDFTSMDIFEDSFSEDVGSDTDASDRNLPEFTFVSPDL